MNKEVKETIKNLQNNELVKNGSYEFIGDSNITYAEIYILLKFIEDLQQENKQLKDNWNELKEFCETDYYGMGTVGVLNKMQELEQGGNSDE